MIDLNNSTTTPLGASQTFTGKYVNVEGISTITITSSANVVGRLYADFSADGVNSIRTITLSDGTTSDMGLHSLIVISKYFRIRIVNGSTAQTTMDTHVLLSTESRICIPTSRTGQTLNNYTDVLNTRNVSDYRSEVALGRRTNNVTWNKFGSNRDLDVGTEVLANFGGTFVPLTTASTFRFVSSSVNDTNGGTGANNLILYGLNSSRESVTEVITLNGTTNVDTTTTWLGVNRLSIYISGSNLSNVGTITCTAITGGAVQARIDPNEGTTQQLIYFTPVNSTSLLSWMLLAANKITGGGGSPNVTFKLWVYSAVSNSKYIVFEYIMDTNVENHIELNPAEPFVVSQKSVTWMEVTTDTNNTICSGRFSLIEHSSL